MTRDKYLASFLFSEGAVLVDMRRLSPKKVEFSFAVDRRLHQLLRLYWSGEPAWVAPASLFEALQELIGRYRSRR